MFANIRKINEFHTFNMLIADIIFLSLHTRFCIMNTKVKGYILAAISAATYGMNPLFALPLYDGGMDLFSVLFFRYLFAIPILAIMLKLRRRDFSIMRDDITALLILKFVPA